MQNQKPLLKNGEIHIWRATLDLPEKTYQRLFSYLSSREKEKGKRLIREILQKRYLSSHAILREILSRYHNVDPSQLEFSFGLHGKPYLNIPYKGKYLQFNMTHSHEKALYAFTLEAEIGIDIEWIQQDIRAMDIAKRFFSEHEYRQLLSLPDDDQVPGFFRCWTRKEAFLKATGEGLSFPLKFFSVDVTKPSSDNCLLSHEKNPNALQRWNVFSLEPSFRNFEASIAYEGTKNKIIYYDWNETNFAR